MTTWSRRARALCFWAVFMAVSARTGSGQRKNEPWRFEDSLIVLQKDETAHSVYFVSGEPDRLGQWLFRADFNKYLEGISLPFWLRLNIAFQTSRGGLDRDGIRFHGATLLLDFTYIGKCDGHWAADSQKPKCRPGAREMNAIDFKDFEDSLSTRERLKLYSYFYRYGSGFPATMEPLCAKCTEGFSELLDSIAQLAGEVDELPVVPKEATQDYKSATEMFNLHRNNKDDIREALYKFSHALKFAPWWRDIFYNRALAAEMLGMYGSAKHDLERYIATKPSTAEVRDAQDRIEEINRLAAGER